MIYNTAVKKDETVNESAPSMMDAMLYIAESEGKMFDSLINIDFMDALNEADLSDQEEDYETGNGATQPDQDTAPDENKKKRFVDVIKAIASKIWALLKKVGEAIANAFKAIVSKVGEIVGTNKGIVSKYGKYATSAKYIEGFPGIENFPGAGADLEKIVKAGLDASDVLEKAQLNECVNLVADIPDKDSEGRKAIIEELNKRIADAAKKSGEIVELANKEGTFNPTPQEMSVIFATLDHSQDIVNAIKNVEKEALQLVDTARQGAKKQESSVGNKLREKTDSDYAAAWKDYYSALSIICKGIHTGTQNSIFIAKQSIKLARRAAIEVGKYAYDKAHGERKDEKQAAKEAPVKLNAEESAAFGQLLGYASDVFVESVFAI